MKNGKYLIPLFILILSLTLIMSATPYIFLSLHLSKYGRINETLLFKHSSTTKNININAELGDIEIIYISPPVDYSVKVELNITMRGSNLAKKSYLDYFRIIWQNNETICDFTLELKPNIDRFEVLSMIENVSTIVTIRKDIKSNINVTTLQGKIALIVPFGTTINNVIINNSEGDILLDFTYCNIEGNIKILSDIGDLVFRVYNVEYYNNTIWTIYMHSGNLAMEIYQNKEMGFNVTGAITIDEGDKDLQYYNYYDTIGASFAYPLINYDDFKRRLTELLQGFIIDLFNGVGFAYESDNYPDINNYNLSFYLDGYCDITLIND